MIHPALLHLTLLFVLTSAIHPAVAADIPPSIRIAQFAGDRAAAISYTFDDGIRDQYTLAVPMLNESGIKGTFFVIPGKVAATTEEAKRRSEEAELRKEDKKAARMAWGTISWDELRDMAKQGHEIESHTWSHAGLTKQTPDQVNEELVKSRDAIAKEIGMVPLTIAYPFNQSTPEINETTLKYYIAYRDHQLGLGGPKSTVESLNKWADRQVQDHAWGVTMAHAIANGGYSAFTDPEILHAHLKYVKSRDRDIWAAPFSEVACYVKEREATKINVLSHSLGSMSLTLESSLDPLKYNTPLTLVIDAPGVKSASAKRSGQELPVRIGNGLIYVEAPPSAQPISIDWK